MPRPVCCRRVGASPNSSHFAPVGEDAVAAPEVVLSLDELEAIRLADLERMYQQQAAEEMGISRQTFGRILEAAHNKVADALVNSKSLRVEGGNVQMVNQRTFACADCANTWQLPCGTGRPAQCPSCGGANFHRVHEDGTVGCCGKQRRHQGRHGCGRSGGGIDSQTAVLTKEA
jgi:predicted DNA-binding protein (UPF0251 family)